jgi:hypothetical protein
MSSRSLEMRQKGGVVPVDRFMAKAGPVSNRESH